MHPLLLGSHPDFSEKAFHSLSADFFGWDPPPKGCQMAGLHGFDSGSGSTWIQQPRSPGTLAGSLTCPQPELERVWSWACYNLATLRVHLASGLTQNTGSPRTEQHCLNLDHTDPEARSILDLVSQVQTQSHFSLHLFELHFLLCAITVK